MFAVARGDNDSSCRKQKGKIFRIFQGSRVASQSDLDWFSRFDDAGGKDRVNYISENVVVPSSNILACQTNSQGRGVKATAG